MKEFADIRKLYTPVQPTGKHCSGDVVYTETLPDQRLLNFIYCYWNLKTTEKLQQHFNYNVVADGCIDIFFDMNCPSENYIMGLCKKHTTFPLENTFHYVGIRFLPSVFPQLFKIKASELSDRTELSALVVPEISRFIDGNFHPNLSPHAIIQRLDQYFLRLLSRISIDPDPRFYEALYRILRNPGMVNIETELDTGISQRQLRRLFDFYIGNPAKSFSKIVRFQNILKAKPTGQSLRKDKLYFESGYYDQAHFIKDFKNFYGVSPGKALGS